MLFTPLALSSLSTNRPILASIALNKNWRVRLKLKQNDEGLSEELQSPFLPVPKMWACGLPPAEKCAIQSVLNCCNFGGVRSQSSWT
jgi:hypothetical protein